MTDQHRSVQEMTFDECFDYVTEHHIGLDPWEGHWKDIIRAWIKLHELRASSVGWKEGFKAGRESAMAEFGWD